MILWLEDKIKARSIYRYRRPDSIPNAGDELALAIVESALRLRDISPFSPLAQRRRLFSIGSVLHFAKTGDTVWGAGVNGKISEEAYRFKTLNVRAVRGPKTAEFLRRRGILVPDIFGDPGLLAPLFYPELIYANGRDKVLYIPHMNQLNRDIDLPSGIEYVSPLQRPGGFIEKILRAKKVISSSLHGIILAEAYGIPAVWLRTTGTEPDFKYLDYFEGTSRFNVSASDSIDEALYVEPEGICDLINIQKRLISSFPYDFWVEPQ